MDSEVLKILLKRLDDIESDTKDLLAFKNRMIGITVAASSLSAFLFSVLMKFFN